MSNFSFSEHGIDLSFPLILDLMLIRDQIEGIDKSIEALAEQYQEREFKKYGDYDDPGEVRYVYQVAEEYLPNTVRMSVVVSLYTSLESNIEQLINYSRTKENQSTSLNEIVKESKTKMAGYQKFISEVLNFDFKFPEQVKENIQHINKIRNCIAHANGNLQHWPDDKVNELIKVTTKLNRQFKVEIESGYNLRLSTKFLIWCLEVVEQAVKPFEEYLKKRYQLSPYHK